MGRAVYYKWNFSAVCYAVPSSTLGGGLSRWGGGRLLNPWFITGFTDAEGCFQIQLRQDMRQKLKWRVGPAFQIKLHIKDIAILEAIKHTLGVGTVTKDSLNMANFNVWSVKELQVIIDHFDRYPLITAKCSDLLLFKQCFEIIKKGEHLTNEGLLKLVSLKNSLNLGLSDKLKKFFPQEARCRRGGRVLYQLIDLNII